MIKQLRKRHLQVWALCGVLIPLGIIVAWTAVPRRATQELLQPPASKTPTFQITSVDTLKSK